MAASPRMDQAYLNEDRGPVVLAVTAATLSIATVFVFLRMVSRIFIVKRVKADDYFMILAWLISLGLSLAICLGTRYGLGQHENALPRGQRGDLSRLEYVFTVLYNPQLMATKTSILIFFLSVSKTNRLYKWMCYATLAVVNVFGLALTLLNIFQCRPMSALFAEPKPDYAHCTDIVTLYLSSGPLNIITDLILLLLPFPVLKGMRLPWKQKLILHITFGFGIFVTAVDVVRISYLQQASVGRLEAAYGGNMIHQSARNYEDNDFSWYASLSFMWSAVECNVGIMCACVPGLKPLVSIVMPRLLRDKGEKTSFGPTDEEIKPRTPTSTDMNAAHRVPSMVWNASGGESGKNANDGQDDSNLDILQFLTTPEMNEYEPPIERTQTALTNTTALTHKDHFFDFVKVDRKKGIVFMTNRESIKPIVYVTVLFFLWGFAYGLLNTLNAQFQLVAGMTTAQTIGLHSAYYGGYLVAPLTFGRIVLKQWGFKACYMVGLLIYGVGTIIFWPAAVLTSFWAFLVSNFIVGMGLSTLEIGANPFIALCGPPEYAEIRLGLSQGFQACGTVVSPLLAKKALFNNVVDASSLIDVQWTYLAITLFTFFLAFIYYCIKLPEVTDEELETAAQGTFPEILGDLRSSNTIWITLGIACFSQFCYVGGQEAVATSIDDYITTYVPGADPVNYEAVAHAVFAASRFIAAGTGWFLVSRWQFVGYYIGVITFSVLAMNFSGTTAGAFVVCVYFFEGPLFPLIYTLPLQGLGKHTKDGAALLTASIAGGGVIQPIMYAVLQGSNLQYSYCVIVATFAFGSIMALWINIHPKAKLQTDERQRMLNRKDPEVERVKNESLDLSLAL